MSNKFESVYSSKVKAGKRRTYFFDVRKTRGEDYYVTLTESTKKHNSDGYERHKIFLYKEDFNRFMDALTDVVDHVKTELLPDYDYNEFTRRHEEYEATLKAEAAAEAASAASLGSTEISTPTPETPKPEVKDTESSADDMTW